MVIFCHQSNNLLPIIFTILACVDPDPKSWRKWIQLGSKSTTLQLTCKNHVVSHDYHVVCTQ